MQKYRNFPYAEANMLYVESPIGVEFSYSNDSSYYIATNDTKTGNKHQWIQIAFQDFLQYNSLVCNDMCWSILFAVEDNLIFLHGWFKKFPEYKTRELYLTREIYVDEVFYSS